MAAEQPISEGYKLVELLFASGFVGVIVAAIMNCWVGRKLQTQKNEHDRQLESLKSELGKKNTVHELQFKKEFELYEGLWKALVDVQCTAIITPTLDMMPKDKSHYDVYKERFDSAVEAFNKANSLFAYHRPFYHDVVSEVTRNLLTQCRGYFRRVQMMLSSESSSPEVYDKADELLKKVREAIAEIEKAIKLRIGLLREAEIVD